MTRLTWQILFPLADVISPKEALLWQAGRYWPVLLVIVLLVVTALLVRHFTRKK